jgi:predicted DCC family thiol-disulfide oxidoreductase YuxK
MPALPTDHSPLLLFDGVCNLCNAYVQWVLKRDKKGIFRFAALQSEAGQTVLWAKGLSGQKMDTVILAVGNDIFSRSDVALEIVRRLGFPWSLLYVFKWVPRPIRDAVYNWVARNRYRWFGRREECMLPRPEWRERFL